MTSAPAWCFESNNISSKPVPVHRVPCWNACQPSHVAWRLCCSEMRARKSPTWLSPRWVSACVPCIAPWSLARLPRHPRRPPRLPLLVQSNSMLMTKLAVPRRAWVRAWVRRRIRSEWRMTLLLRQAPRRWTLRTRRRGCPPRRRSTSRVPWISRSRLLVHRSARRRARLRATRQRGGRRRLPRFLRTSALPRPLAQVAPMWPVWQRPLPPLRRCRAAHRLRWALPL
mmetsp:Transcript_12551/g.40104  ORF Transcript_12551/g.40104 Transcript_12551/m.40104 type:complete len:227 (-) Transcript_12551:204-884(-)